MPGLHDGCHCIISTETRVLPSDACDWTKTSSQITAVHICKSRLSLWYTVSQTFLGEQGDTDTEGKVDSV